MAGRDGAFVASIVDQEDDPGRTRQADGGVTPWGV
jgi:hypothetical protein